MSVPGYEQLAAVLQAAYDQAATGKGAERHADKKPFHEQPMQTGSDLLGTDAGLAFQAIKKVREGSTFAEFDRFEREMLGAINYIAGMVIWRRRQLPDAPSFTAQPAKDVLAEVDETARRIGSAAVSNQCHYCGRPDGVFHHPDCHLLRRGKSDMPAYYEQVLAARRALVGATDPDGRKVSIHSGAQPKCPECEYPTDAAGTHYATCSKLTAPKEFVDQVEQVFDELESSVSGQCPECGAALGTRHRPDCAEYAPMVEPTTEPEKVSMLDDYEEWHCLVCGAVHTRIGHTHQRIGFNACRPWCPEPVEAAEPAAEIDDESPRAQAIGQNGNTGEHYNDPWAGAPEWAKYKAQDGDGSWWWYEHHIKAGRAQWLEPSDSGQIEKAGEDDPNPNWRDTLIQRP